MILEILKYPNSLLRQKSQSVEKVDLHIRKLVEEMFETMYAAPGVGLAAPQIGILKRILIVDIGGRLDGKERTRPDPRVLINPVIVTREEKIVWEEGCLSLPQLIVPVERSKKIVVEALDQNGKMVKHLGEDLLAVAFQHEIDHLEGVLLVDRLSRLKRELYKRKVEKLARGEKVEDEVEHGKGPAYIG
ncbi:MAG: peptide deformylase [Deltaproteobacteria bacterium]|nr:peptide deformylase [Deltaproteobacteria bacterium]